MRRCHRKSGGKILQVRRCHRTSGGKILQVRRCHRKSAGKILEVRRCHRTSGGKILLVRRCHRKSGGKILQVRRCHPNTAGGSKAPSQNCKRSMQFGLGTSRMPMCGKLRYSFRRTLILSCARKFLQQKPVLKDIFSPARLQHINVNMLPRNFCH